MHYNGFQQEKILEIAWFHYQIGTFALVVLLVLFLIKSELLTSAGLKMKRLFASVSEGVFYYYSHRSLLSTLCWHAENLVRQRQAGYVCKGNQFNHAFCSLRRGKSSYTVLSPEKLTHCKTNDFSVGSV